MPIDTTNDKISVPMDTDFPRWLAERRKERGWSQADLARAAHISPQVVSDYEGRKRKYYDENILQNIARGFKLPIETVYRAAGFLPPKDDVDQWVEETAYKLNLIPPSLRGIVTNLIDSLVKDTEESQRVKSKPRQRSSTSQ